MPLSPKQISWAGLLASGFVILSGFLSSLFVVLAFSDSQGRDTALVVIVFAVIVILPFHALSTPRDPEEKVQRQWWKFWRRRKRKKPPMQKYWMRSRGQEKNQPFGHPEVAKPASAAKPSTFVAAPRKPTEP